MAGNRCQRSACLGTYCISNNWNVEDAELGVRIEMKTRNSFAQVHGVMRYPAFPQGKLRLSNSSGANYNMRKVLKSRDPLR